MSSEENTADDMACTVRQPELLHTAIYLIFDVEERIGSTVMDYGTLRMVSRRACAIMDGNRKRADLSEALFDHQ